MSRRRLLVALSAAVLLAACSGAPDDLEAWLVGSAFRADPGAAGSQHPPIVEGSLIEVRFGAGTLSATGGCNDMVGRRVVEGAALVLPDGLASTERACDSGLMAQDDWVAALLESRPELVVEEDGRRLIVTGEHMLVLVRRDPAPIAGTVWRLSAIGDVGPDGSVSVVDGSSTLDRELEAESANTKIATPTAAATAIRIGAAIAGAA